LRSLPLVASYSTGLPDGVVATPPKIQTLPAEAACTAVDSDGWNPPAPGIVTAFHFLPFQFTTTG
jgi:hypothetical protein